MTWTRLSELMGRHDTDDAGLRSADRQVASIQGSSGPPADDLLDGDVTDDDFLPRNPPTLGTRTALLVAALACACAFLGGVQIQKHHDSGVTSSSGLPTGFSGGLGGLPTGGPFGGTATDAGPATPSATGAATGTDSLAVVGTVSKITPGSVTVTDLGGTKHTVRITRTTTLIKNYRTSAKPLAVGATVSVTGTTADNGLVTATAVTIR